MVGGTAAPIRTGGGGASLAVPTDACVPAPRLAAKAAKSKPPPALGPAMLSATSSSIAPSIAATDSGGGMCAGAGGALPMLATKAAKLKPPSPPALPSGAAGAGDAAPLDPPLSLPPAGTWPDEGALVVLDPLAFVCSCETLGASRGRDDAKQQQGGGVEWGGVRTLAPGSRRRRLRRFRTWVSYTSSLLLIGWLLMAISFMRIREAAARIRIPMASLSNHLARNLLQRCRRHTRQTIRVRTSAARVPPRGARSHHAPARPRLNPLDPSGSVGSRTRSRCSRSPPDAGAPPSTTGRDCSTAFGSSTSTLPSPFPRAIATSRHPHLTNLNSPALCWGGAPPGVQESGWNSTWEAWDA